MLNSEQRFIFDDIINRLITGHFEDEQFLIYIRYFCILLYKFYKTILQWRCWSFLFNTLMHAAKHILRQEGDSLEQPRVLNLAPSKKNTVSNILCYFLGGVAATIIEGI